MNFILNFFKRFHKWEYRNPYGRTCKKCGRLENVFEHENGKHYWEEMVSTVDKTAPCAK